MNSSPFVKPEVVFIEDLLEEMHLGLTKIPAFQRVFVWRPGNMTSLFDSIYKGYPIGGLYLWEPVGGSMSSSDKIGPLPIQAETSPKGYVLDGQQRLTTLFVCLRLPGDFPQDNKQEHWQWWIYFDLEKKEFTHHKKGAVPKTFFPLRAVLKTTDFLKVARALEKNFPERPDLIEQAEAMAQKIKAYKLGITRVVGGNLGQAVEIFSRLNTSGMSMTPDQMLSALTYKEGGEPTLAQNIDEVLEKLAGYHFDDTNRRTILLSFLAAAGIRVRRSEWDAHARDLRENMQAIPSAEKGLMGAADFLYSDLKVPGNILLPYTNQFLLLSVFFRKCEDPTPAQRELLRKWFWATSYSGWFASRGSNSTQINNGMDEMEALARGELTTFEHTPLDEPVRPFPDRFDLRSSRIRTLLLYLVTLEPRDPSSGEPYRAAVLVNQLKRWFHIFYSAGKPYVSDPANRILFEKQPGLSIRSQLLNIEEKHRESVLKSHGIPMEAYPFLETNNPENFISTRKTYLAQQERAFIRSKGLEPPSDKFGESEIDTGD